MATSKSYTDLEQSKKLAEILQLKSADNVIVKFGDREGTTTLVMPKETLDAIRTPLSDIRDVIPCWSLTALLGVLPSNKNVITTVSRGGWQMEPTDYLPNVWWCEYEDNESCTIFSTQANNPIDACYEMIIKLHKEGLL